MSDGLLNIVDRDNKNEYKCEGNTSRRQGLYITIVTHTWVWRAVQVVRSCLPTSAKTNNNGCG